MELANAGMRIAVASRDTVRVWDLDNPKALRVRVFDYETKALAFHADAGTLAVATGSIEIWDLVADKVVSRLPYQVDYVGYSGDGKTLVARTIDGEFLHCQTDEYSCESISPKSNASQAGPIFASDDGAAVAWCELFVDGVNVWGLRGSSSGSWQTVAVAAGLCGSATPLTGNGPLLVSGDDLLLWDPESDSVIYRSPSQRLNLIGSGRVAFSPDGRVWALSGAGAYIWRIDSPDTQAVLATSFPASAVAFSQDSEVAVVGLHGSIDPGTVEIFRRQGPQYRSVGRAGSTTDRVSDIAVNGDGTLAAVLLPQVEGASVIEVIDIATARVVGKSEFVGSSPIDAGIVFVPGQPAVIATTRGAVTLWNWEADLRRTIASGENHYRFVHLCADGATLVIQGGGRIRVLDLPTGTLHSEIAGVGASSLAVAPDCGALAAVSDFELKVWHLPQVKSVSRARYSGYAGGKLQSVSFGPDGSQLITGTSDGAIVLWSRR